MLRSLSFLVVLLAVTGCRSHRQMDCCPYTDEGVLKPRVAIASVTDTSGIAYPWDVSEELSHGVGYHLKNDGTLYVLPKSEVSQSAGLLTKGDYYAGDAVQWKSFCNADYVILIDLFERKELPFEKGKFYPLFPTTGHHSSNVLAMKLRVKVLDIRGIQPKVVLSEVMESNHLLPWNSHEVDYALCTWGDEYYRNTPIGCAHNHLVSQLADRLKMVISDV